MKFKNYRNPYTNDNRIYSFKDLYNMPFGELIRNKQEVLGQYRVLGVPTEQELQSSGNVIWVEAYKRDDGTEVKGHWRSKPDGSLAEPRNNQKTKDITKKNEYGTVTGGASEVKQEIKEEKDIPEMTKSAESQENIIKNLPAWEVKMNPEQEYYRIAFELKAAIKNGEIPDWMKEHNDIRTLDKIGNEENKKALKEKIIQGAKENGDTETLNNLDKVYVVTAKMDSEITKDIVNNPYFQDELKNRLDDISQGKYKDSSFSIDFPTSEHKIVADFNKDFSTHNTIGKCDVYNVKIESNGEISATIIDYYNFDKHNMATRAKNAYLQQQNGRLCNYALMIPIRVKLKK